MSMTVHRSACPFESDANAIYNALQPGSLDQLAAELYLRDLHKRVEDLAKGLRLGDECEIPRNLNGVLNTLVQIEVAHFQGNHSLKCAFAKTVHVLSEVSFWQGDAQGLPMQETAKSVKQIADKLLESTDYAPCMRPLDRVPVTTVVTRFHSNSLLQLSRCLTEGPGLLSLFMTGAQLVKPIATADAITALENLATTVTQGASTWTESWLMNTLKLRWDALVVDSPDDFDQLILPYIEKYTEQGQEYTVCLAMVLMDLIIDKDRTQDVRNQALLMLLTLTTKTSRGFTDKMKHVKAEVSSRVAGNSDRFATTREVVRAFLAALSLAPEFQAIVHQKLATSASAAQAANCQEELQHLKAVIGDIDKGVIEGIDLAMQNAAEPYDTLVDPYINMRAHLQQSALRGANQSVTEEEIKKLRGEMDAERLRIMPLLEEHRIAMQNQFEQQLLALDTLLTPGQPASEGAAV